jgi:hypothetical protein
MFRKREPGEKDFPPCVCRACMTRLQGLQQEDDIV